MFGLDKFGLAMFGSEINEIRHRAKIKWVMDNSATFFKLYCFSTKSSHVEINIHMHINTCNFQRQK